MIPSSPLANRWSHPDFHYSFKHSFSPAGSAMPAGQAASGAAEAAAMAGAAAGGGHGGPPHAPGMHYHMYGRGQGPWMHRRRFGPFRRLFWFGLGVAAGTWYYAHKERKREIERLVRPGAGDQQPAWGCENSWTRRWKQMETAQPQPIPPVKHSAKDQSSFSTAVSDPVTTFDTTPPPSTYAPLPAPGGNSDRIEERRGGWTWGERRRRRHEAREAEVKAEEALRIASKAANGAGERQETATPEGHEEMRRLREVVEGLWADKKLAAANAQTQETDKAKEYVREKLDKLSVALESLRESLKSEAEKQPDKKLV